MKERTQRTDDEKRAILERIAARPKGMSLDEASVKYGIAKVTWYKWAAKFGKDGRGGAQSVAPEQPPAAAESQSGRPQKYPRELREKAVAMFLNRPPGETARTIATKLGMSGESDPGLIGYWVMQARKGASPTTAPPPPAPQQTQLALAGEPAEPAAVVVARLDKTQKTLGELKEKIQKLEEDNAILRGIATLAIGRGVLQLTWPERKHTP